MSGSGVLFAIAVLQAQQGCDRREPEPEQTTSPASAEPPASGAPAKAAPAAAAPTANAAETPEAKLEAKADAQPEAKPQPKERKFFPASKSGGLHVRNPAPAQQEPPKQKAD